MRALQLQGVHRRKFVRTTQRDDTLAPAPDLVCRNFNPLGPDELSVADITYLPTWAGYLYLAVVVHPYTRPRARWRTSHTLPTAPVLTPLHITLHNHPHNAA